MLVDMYFNLCYIKVFVVIWIVNRLENNIICYLIIIMKKVFNFDCRVIFEIKCVSDGFDIKFLIDGNIWYLRNNMLDIFRLNLFVF